MSMGNPSIKDNVLVYAAVPELKNDGALTTGWMPVTNVIRLWGFVLVGGTDVTVDAAIQQAKDSSGTSAKALSKAASITQITALQDDRWCSIDVEVDAAAFDLANSFNHAGLVITCGDATGADVAGLLLGWVRHRPPTQLNAYAEKIEIAG